MSDEESSSQQSKSEEGGGGGSQSLIIMAIVSVVLLGGGFALAYFVLPGQVVAMATKDWPKVAAADAHGAPADAHGGGEAKKEGEGAHGGEAKKEGEGGEAKKEGEAAKGGAEGKPADFRIEDLYVNTAGSRGARTAKISISIEADAPVLAEMTSRQPRIVDTVSMVIGSKSSEELTAPTSRAVLRAEITATLNAILTKGKVKNVYFLELLIQ